MNRYKYLINLNIRILKILFTHIYIFELKLYKSQLIAAQQTKKEIKIHVNVCCLFHFVNNLNNCHSLI